jgi:hypothetical protein
VRVRPRLGPYDSAIKKGACAPSLCPLARQLSTRFALSTGQEVAERRERHTALGPPARSLLTAPLGKMGLALSPHHCSRHRYFPRHKARLAVIGIQSTLSARSVAAAVATASGSRTPWLAKYRPSIHASQEGDVSR